MKLLILGTVPEELLNLKVDLIKTILKKNYKVIASSSSINPNTKIGIENSNFTYDAIYLKRHGYSLIGNIRTLASLFNLYRKHKPDYILASGIKLVIWGGIAAKVRRTFFCAHITGLGYAFQGKSISRKFLTTFVSFLYKVALKNAKAVIFENKDNRDLFVNKGIICKSKSFVINGSGVNLKKYSFTRIPETPINFLVIARLLSEKGIREYAAAAKIVKEKFPDIKFDLVGSQDESLDAIPLEEVLSWSDYINYHGYIFNIEEVIKSCHVFVLPSYHEGLPRCTLEAMSTGRPILTTNAVGCRETVSEGYNGFMVPVGSSKKLASKMIWFIENQEKIKIMGQNSRILAEKKFDIHEVNKEILNIIGI